MHGQFLHPPFANRVHPWVVPDISAITTSRAKCDVVLKTPRAALKNQDKLVLGAIEGAHSGIIFVPDAQVLEVGINPITCGQDFTEVTPVHADVVYGAAATVICEMPKDCS
jgi:hypothetical protein